MTYTRVSTEAAMAQINALTDLLDEGPKSGELRIYSGKTLLASLPLNDPAFGEAVTTGKGAIAHACPIYVDTNATGTGRADNFCAVNGKGSVVIEGDCGESNASLIMDNINLISGQMVMVREWSIKTQ